MWVKKQVKQSITSHLSVLTFMRIALSALLLLCLVPEQSTAQIFTRRFAGDPQKRLPKYDRQRLHFGFSLGVNSTTFAVRNVENIQQFDSVFVIDPQPQVGFNLGIITDLRIGQHFNLRFIPDLSFADRRLKYTLSTIDTLGQPVERSEEQKLESVLLEFPLSLKFKSVRINDGNWRVYILGGGKFIMDMASQSKIKTGDNEVVVKLNRIDYAYEAGVGFDIYMQYFKFSPELKVSFGLNNLLVKDETIYTQSINKLNSMAFLLSFHFE
jgi:hypothetical protein